ncbi:hypothetical protein MRX96_019578 [Rhipicephalus microplus]
MASAERTRYHQRFNDARDVPRYVWSSPAAIVTAKSEPPMSVDSSFVETPACNGRVTLRCCVVHHEIDAQMARLCRWHKKTEEGLQMTLRKTTYSVPGVAATSKSKLVNGMPTRNNVDVFPKTPWIRKASPALLTTPRQRQQEPTLRNKNRTPHTLSAGTSSRNRTNRIECGSRAREPSSEPGSCAVDASPRQELSTAAAKPTAILNPPPSPPLLRPRVASARRNPASTAVCLREGHQPTTTSQWNYDQSRGMPTTKPIKQEPNASWHTAVEATAPDDALMRDEGDALAASSPCLPYVSERAMAGGTRTGSCRRDVATPVSPPGPSRLAQAPTQHPVKEWTVEDVVRFVESIPGCACHAEQFRKGEVNGKRITNSSIETPGPSIWESPLVLH